jgi:hypothetical protein
MYYRVACPTSQHIIPASAILQTVPCRTAATVAVDFDGVLHPKSGRFSNEVTGDPVPGAADSQTSS